MKKPRNHYCSGVSSRSLVMKMLIYIKEIATKEFLRDTAFIPCHLRLTTAWVEVVSSFR